MTIHRFLMALMPAILLGQSSGPDFSELKTFLGLTDAQLTQLRDLRTQERQALRSVADQIAEKQGALRQALEAGSTDALRLGQLLVDIQNLRKQIEATNQTYRAQAVALLTADQKTKLAQLEAAAKLAPAIRQATALNLLDSSGGAPFGPGFGLRGLGRGLGLGPLGFGPGTDPGPAAGMGRMMRLRRGF
ncbi:MAG: Spy/CpxP family protein refolding chaperone [Bryobacterales bacterium]|nr:Spy/CpxP family protein refolding chaperone [Bryobacteraceae bacterium]MDW8354511.1 Spy/CpxP family protein refolding chaperone [Bryobacterales bacterium]